MANKGKRYAATMIDLSEIQYFGVQQSWGQLAIMKGLYIKMVAL